MERYSSSPVSLPLKYGIASAMLNVVQELKLLIERVNF